MRETYHNLRRRPFPTTPDLSCYYPSETHERALAALREGLAEGEGVLVLVGPPGSGKTLLGHALLEAQGPGVGSIFLMHGCFPTRSALLQALLYDLGLAHEGKADHEMRLALTDHVLKTYAAGKKTLIVIDEAHYLAVGALEELRLLGNLEGRAGRATQLVLLGQPELLPLLGRPEVTSLRQRIGVRAQLEPLAEAEAVDYLLHHVRQAGGLGEQLLTEEGVALLARGTRGVPRLLNQAGHLALGMSAEAGMPVDAEVAMEALAALGLSAEESPVEDEQPARVDSPRPGIDPRVVSGDGEDEQETAAPRLFVVPRQVS